MVKPAFVPDAGDLVWLDFDPQAGREQAGRRPALILSPAAYNGKTGLAIACPVTTHIKGYPFEVLLPSHGAIHGAVLCDHLRSVDWRARKAARAESASARVMQDVRSRLGALIGIR